MWVSCAGVSDSSVTSVPLYNIKRGEGMQGLSERGALPFGKGGAPAEAGNGSAQEAPPIVLEF